MKKAALCVLLFIIGIGVCGCRMGIFDIEIGQATEKEMVDTEENMTVAEEDSEQELTERQKAILESIGLPTEIEKLTYRQEKAIKGIEELLTYLEEKYHREFAYVDYSLPSTISGEELRARVPEGDSLDNFNVRRREDGSIEDDYMLVALRDDYAQYVQDLLVSGLENERIKVCAQLYTTELMEIPSNKGDYKGNVSSGNTIFVYLSDSGEEQMDACFEAIKKILEDEDVSYDNDVIFLKEDIIDEITKYNFSECLSPIGQYHDYCISRQVIIVD